MSKSGQHRKSTFLTLPDEFSASLRDHIKFCAINLDPQELSNYYPVRLAARTKEIGTYLVSYRTSGHQPPKGSYFLIYELLFFYLSALALQWGCGYPVSLSSPPFWKVGLRELATGSVGKGLT